jgi:hypothetical protein
MNSKTEKFLTRIGMLAVVAFLVLPMSAFAQGNGRGRGKPTEVFVNGHDARDGRLDKDQKDKHRDGIRNSDELQRRRAAEEAQRQREIEAARRQRDNDTWRRNQGNDDWRRRNDDNNRSDRNSQYDRNRRGRNWDRYGGYGGSFQLRQTALNAGYNNGIQEGRKDRSHGDRFDYRDEGDYQRATEDYSSRLGDRELYRRYFREGFANGYEDGYRGY